MRKEYRLLLVSLILGICLCGLPLHAQATNRDDYLDSLNVGVAQIVDPTGRAANEDAIRELTEVSEANGAERETDLVMANVQVAMNVRAEADGESEKVGLLYKDCGGRIGAGILSAGQVTSICFSARMRSCWLMTWETLSCR